MCAREKANQQYILKVIQNIQFLTRQGIAFRGDGDEKDSNFMQLLLLRSTDTLPKSFLERKTDKYTSPQIQNELLTILALQVLREITDLIHRVQNFTLMADEVTDVSNRERVVVCMRWGDGDFHLQEDFISLYKLAQLLQQNL